MAYTAQSSSPAQTGRESRIVLCKYIIQWRLFVSMCPNMVFWDTHGVRFVFYSLRRVSLAHQYNEQVQNG